MKNLRILIIYFLLTSMCLTLVSGNKGKFVIPDHKVKSVALLCYRQLSDSSVLSHNTAQVDLVKQVGADLAKAVENYFQYRGISFKADSFQWEFCLVKNARVNVFCLPGGKTVLFDGIFPLVKNYTGVATILSHEMAHLMVKHYNIRLARQLRRVGVSGTKNQELAVFRAMRSIYGVDSSRSEMPPYTFDEEIEADRLALIFMAMAGYDPTDGIKFWKRMDSLSDKHSIEYLRIHPIDDKRTTHMDALFREVIDYYKYD